MEMPGPVTDANVGDWATLGRALIIPALAKLVTQTARYGKVNFSSFKFISKLQQIFSNTCDPLQYFPHQFSAYYIEENNIIAKDLLLFSK